MARTWTTQWDMESTIRSPRSALRSLTRGSAFGAVATLTTSAAAASGARNIESPPDARILNRVREERHSQMHLASTSVANIRPLWCLGNIMGNAAAWHPRSNFGPAAGLRPGGTLLPRAALTSVSPNRQRDWPRRTGRAD